MNEKINSISGDFENKRVNQMQSLGQTFGFDIDNRIKESEKKRLSQILNQSGNAEDKLKTYIEGINKIKGKFHFSDVESDLFKIFSDSGGYQQTLKEIYGFQRLSGIKNTSDFYTYLNSNNNWKKLYKDFFGAENAPSTKDDLDKHKEDYVIQRAS